MGKIRQLISILSFSVLLGLGALAQSNLTQIRDTVYNSDGTPFNGTVVLTFNGFTSSSAGSTASPLSTSARIYNGLLSVLLIPSTTATTGSYYQAVYRSTDGTITWTETWSVPVSTTALTLSSVRTSSNSGTTTGGSGGTSTSTTYATLPIAITDVTGLSSQLSTLTNSLASLGTTVTGNTGSISSLQTTVASLNANVTSNSSMLTSLNSTVSGMSSTVSANNSALTALTSTVNGLTPTVNSNSTAVTSLTSTVGSLGSSVTNLQNTVSSLSASISSSGQTVPYVFVDGETPAGTLDGSNAAFTLVGVPNPVSSLELYRNGLVQTSGIDFTLSGKNVTFLTGNIPMTTDVLQAYYRTAGSSSVFTFVDNETPQGTIDGTNLTFTLTYAPTPGASLKLYKNGMLLRLSADYSLSGTTITFVTATTPHSGDSLNAFYRH